MILKVQYDYSKPGELGGIDTVVIQDEGVEKHALKRDGVPLNLKSKQIAQILEQIERYNHGAIVEKFFVFFKKPAARTLTQLSPLYFINGNLQLIQTNKELREVIGDQMKGRFKEGKKIIHTLEGKGQSVYCENDQHLQHGYAHYKDGKLEYGTILGAQKIKIS